VKNRMLINDDLVDRAVDEMEKVAHANPNSLNTTHVKRLIARAAMSVLVTAAGEEATIPMSDFLQNPGGTTADAMKKDD
jgi:hypothetical protein